MNLRWLWFEYRHPELQLSRAQRREVRRRAFFATKCATRFTWREMLWALVPAIAGLIPMQIYFTLKLDVLYLLAALPMQVALTWLLFAIVARLTWRPRYLRALRESGHDVCLSCGYLLRGLQNDVHRCPECGATREQ